MKMLISCCSKLAWLSIFYETHRDILKNLYISSSSSQWPRLSSSKKDKNYYKKPHRSLKLYNFCITTDWIFFFFLSYWAKLEKRINLFWEQIILLSQFFLINQLIWFTNLTGLFFHAVTMNGDWRLSFKKDVHINHALYSKSSNSIQ